MRIPSGKSQILFLRARIFTYPSPIKNGTLEHHRASIEDEQGPHHSGPAESVYPSPGREGEGPLLKGGKSYLVL